MCSKVRSTKNKTRTQQRQNRLKNFWSLTEERPIEWLRQVKRKNENILTRPTIEIVRLWDTVAVTFQKPLTMIPQSLYFQFMFINRANWMKKQRNKLKTWDKQISALVKTVDWRRNSTMDNNSKTRRERKKRRKIECVLPNILFSSETLRMIDSLMSTIIHNIRWISACMRA